jgi:hypothetical protein
MSALLYCKLEQQARQLVDLHKKGDITTFDFMQEVSLLGVKLARLNIQGELVIKV